MKTKNIDFSRFAAIGISLALAAGLLWLAVTALLPVLLPFLLAWGAALLLRPLNLYLHQRTRLPLRLVSCVSVLVLLLLFLSVTLGVLLRLFAEARGILTQLAEDPAITERFFERLYALLPMEAGSPALSRLSEYLHTAVLRSVDALAGKLPSVVGSALLSLPEVLLFLLVTVIAAVYFSMDLDRVHERLRALLPASLASRLGEARRGALRMGGAYLRAYLTLSGIVFLLMIVGLSFLRVRYALLLAALLTALDLLPVLGVGAVLVPWGILSLLFGNTATGIGLLVLFLVTAIVRQVAEPRLVGQMLGVHPLLSLFSLYLGARLFGILGLLLGPLIAILLRLLYRYFSAENKKPVK